MAAMTYREKRRFRGRAVQGGSSRSPTRSSAEPAKLISLGTVGSLVPQMAQGPQLCVVVSDRYEVRVGNGFQVETLARLVRTLELLA